MDNEIDKGLIHFVGPLGDTSIYGGAARSFVEIASKEGWGVSASAVTGPTSTTFPPGDLSYPVVAALNQTKVGTPLQVILAPRDTVIASVASRRRVTLWWSPEALVVDWVAPPARVFKAFPFEETPPEELFKQCGYFYRLLGLQLFAERGVTPPAIEEACRLRPPVGVVRRVVTFEL